MKDRIVHLLLKEKNDRFKGGLYDQSQVKLACNSNRIEGSRLSEDQTRFIYETNTIHTEVDEAASVDEIVETINHFACFDFMLERTDELLSEAMIKEFHYMLKRNASDERRGFKVGDYKTRPNMVGDSETTEPSEVAFEIQR